MKDLRLYSLIVIFSAVKLEPLLALDRGQKSNEVSIGSWLVDNKLMNNKQLMNFQNLEVESVPASNRDANTFDYQRSTCQLVRIMHLLYQNGCQPKAIASYACAGACPSYVQASTSKFWQHERSCTCCQQTSLQEATFTLDCPSLDPPYRKVKTYSPVDCMCRACTDLGKENLQPQELVEALASEPGLN